jgi:4-hydroxyphenylacetate 3-monooxygenase
MIVELQTVRSALTAAELDPDLSSVLNRPAPNYIHVASGSIKMLQAHQRISEILRILPGSSMVVAPSDNDLANPEMTAGIEESFGGGGYTALQRMALLNLAWDHIGSGLDGREAAFELHCNGGIPAWRGQARMRFPDYNRLANGVLRAISIEMPTIDVDALREVSRMPQRREVTPVTSATIAAANGAGDGGAGQNGNAGSQ